MTENESINIQTCEGIIVCLPQHLFNNTEFGQLRTTNKYFFAKTNEPIQIPFSISSIVSCIGPKREMNDLALLENVECMLYFYPSAINCLSVRMEKIFEWNKVDTTLTFSDDCFHQIKSITQDNGTSLSVTISFSNFSQSITLFQTTIMEFFDYLETKDIFGGLPIDECRLLFASFGIEPFKDVSQINQWITRICSSDYKFFSKTGLLSQKWISNIHYPLMDVFGKYVYDFLGADNLLLEKNQKINQHLLKHLISVYPQTKSRLWPYIESDECFLIFINQYYSTTYTNDYLGVGSFRTFLKKLYLVISNNNNFDNLLQNLAEMVADIWKTHTPNYCPIHYFLNKHEKRGLLKQKLITVLSMRIALSSLDGTIKKSYVTHLYKLLVG